MQILLNGDPHEVADQTTVQALVEHVTGTHLAPDGTRLDGRRLGVAVAVAQSVVPRSQWSTRVLTAGQAVDLVTAVQGG